MPGHRATIGTVITGLAHLHSLSLRPKLGEQQQQQQLAATAAALLTNRPPMRHLRLCLAALTRHPLPSPYAASSTGCLRWKTLPNAFTNSLYQNKLPDLIEPSSMGYRSRGSVDGGWCCGVLSFVFDSTLGAFLDDARCENNPLPLPFGFNLIN